MTLPEVITVLSYTYDVKVVPPKDESLDGAYGKVDFEGMSIYLSDKIRGNFLRETLMHEVFHILDYHTAGADHILKERDIQRLSAVLFDTLVRNPALMKGVKTRSP